MPTKEALERLLAGGNARDIALAYGVGAPQQQPAAQQVSAPPPGMQAGGTVDAGTSGMPGGPGYLRAYQGALTGTPVAGAQAPMAPAMREGEPGYLRAIRGAVEGGVAPMQPMTGPVPPLPVQYGTGAPPESASGRREGDFAPPPHAQGWGGGGMVGPSETPQIMPERIRRIEGAQAMQRSGMEDATRAQLEQNEIESRGAGVAGMLQKKQADEGMYRAHVRDADAGMRIAQMDQASKEAADMKIDPDRYWNSRSTGQQISFVIGSALAGFVNGGTHGRGAHDFLEDMNHHIDQDIDAQRKEIEAKHGRVGDMQGILAETYKRSGNMEQAVKEANLLSLQQVQSEMQSEMAAAKNPIAQANGQVALGQLQEKIEREQASLYAYHPGGYAGGGGMPAAAAGGIGALKPHDRERAVTMPDGSVRLASSGEEARKLQQQMESSEGLGQSLATIRDVYERGTWYANTPEGRARLNAAKTQASLSLPSFMSGSNRLNETELEAAHKLVGEAGSVLNTDWTGNARDTAAALQQQIAARQRSIGQETYEAVPAPAGAGPAQPLQTLPPERRR